MEGNYTDEIIDVNNISSSQPNEISYETTQLFTNFFIGLSEQIAYNNEAKYKELVKVKIADICAKMQEELQDINGYYNIREKQEEHFNKIITSYQEQLKSFTDLCNSEGNKKNVANMKWAIKRLDKQLDKLAKNIKSEQKKRSETSKSRNKRTVSFFSRR